MRYIWWFAFLALDGFLAMMTIITERSVYWTIPMVACFAITGFMCGSMVERECRTPNR